MSDFDDVGEFHRKFDLPVASDGLPRELTGEELEFRLKFLIEELSEYAEAVGLKLMVSWGERLAPGRLLRADGYPVQDLPKAFDALLDLAYVALGTAHIHRFPWQAGWDEVQRANVAKERCGVDHVYVGHDSDCDVNKLCTGDGCHLVLHAADDEPSECGKPSKAHSLRGSALDVIKPPGWKPPDIAQVLARVFICPMCDQATSTPHGVCQI